MKTFTKNDSGFQCVNCGKIVPPLGYTSRNHCPWCLCSIHIDNFPGDRQNSCKGVQRPISVEPSSKKGYIITYKCDKCNAITRNKAAEDDDFNMLLAVQKNYSNNGGRG